MRKELIRIVRQLVPLLGVGPAGGSVVTARIVPDPLLQDRGHQSCVANNTNVAVIDLLLAVNTRTRNGLLFDADGNGALSSQELINRVLANNIFTGINEAGDI